MPEDISEEFSGAEPSRRAFITRYGGMVFAAPVIASFALDGLARDRESHEHHHGRPCDHQHPNQGYPNQTHPNQTHPNQGYPNQ
jgi:hypothetical protein